LRHIKLHFLAKITQIVSDFSAFQILEGGKFAASIERQKVKSVSASGGFAAYPSD